MDRWACVDVAALPLQILLREHPDWTGGPVVVVEADRPNAAVLWVNAHARRLGVRTGHRYATALALARDLHAGTVSPVEVGRQVHALTTRLRLFSPRVEPAQGTPGLFWLDASGLERLYPSLAAWAESLCADLRRIQMHAVAAVGFSRFGTYALALSQRRRATPLVCVTPEDERIQVSQVSIARVVRDPDERDRLLALRVSTVGELLCLPVERLRLRVGPETEALHRLASGSRWSSLVPTAPDARYVRAVDFDAPESQVDRLIFVIKRLLDSLAAVLARDHKVMTGVRLRLTYDDRTIREEHIRPAAPAIDVAPMLALIRLRLDATFGTLDPGPSDPGLATAGKPLDSGFRRAVVKRVQGIIALRVTAESSLATADQRTLLAAHTRRDPDAANQAFARLRAELGETCVARAQLREAHLPGARFTWEPMTTMPSQAQPRVVATRPLIRRIVQRPAPLPGFTLDDPRHLDVQGPYVVSGGWWHGGTSRHYYFVRTVDGGSQWVYYDQRRRRFFLQGLVQ